MKKNIIKNIISGNYIDEIFNDTMNRLFIDGPTSTTVLETLTYINMFASEKFESKKEDVLEVMGVFYKNAKPTTLKSSIFNMYENYIEDKYHQKYTPVQANILQKIRDNKCFSFSAPTSTGKSHVFRKIIEQSTRDIVIIVPSRALINEYYDSICRLVEDKAVNILTFVDKINTKHAKRNVFILTPERSKELFKYKNEFDIELFLFDEAQLSDEDSVRGLYFDSIVRRIQKSFPCSKCVFAHPFVKNPNAQILKNNFELNESTAYQYRQKNVGQIFFTHKNDDFYHFGIEKDIMGNQKILCEFDPIMRTILNNGSVLIYTTKASIYNKTVFEDFSKYISAYKEITDKEALGYIYRLKKYIGANDKGKGYYHSHMISMLKKGIVIHHGSLPLQARLILEHFTQKGFCRLCFATSTLEQGINMPFDVVYLNTFQASKPLSLKNLIGRAGRSSNELKFDYGSVVLNDNNKSKFREIMLADDELSEISQLDDSATDKDKDEDYKEFKEAINNGTFSDEYNLTNSEVERLGGDSVDFAVSNILNSMFENQSLISLKKLNKDHNCKLSLYNHFVVLYVVYLNGRQLTDGERSVLNTAIKILLWKVHCKTFKDICWYRYSYAAKIAERKKLQQEYNYTQNLTKKKHIKNEIDGIYANFVSGYADLPNNNLKNFSMFGFNQTKARDVDYDRIVFDTYDYLDKLIGFKLSDIFYAIFYQYYKKTNDERALKLSKYFKYGTDDEKEIWMLRYGLSFEDIEWAKDYVLDINEEEIVFKKEVVELSKEQLEVIERFI